MVERSNNECLGITCSTVSSFVFETNETKFYDIKKDLIARYDIVDRHSYEDGFMERETFPRYFCNIRFLVPSGVSSRIMSIRYRDIRVHVSSL